MRSAVRSAISSALFSSLVLASLAACGGDDGGGADDDDTTTPDAMTPENEGFVTPDHVTMANTDDAEVGPANWDCLGTPTADMATTVDVTVTGVIKDFRTPANEVRDATVTAFVGTDYANPVDTFTPTTATGAYELTLPAGTARWGFKVSAPDYRDTFLLNQYFDPAMAAQTRDISAISEGTATALPALIGITATPGTGVLAGAIRDCDGNEVSYAVATVASVSAMPDHLTGAQTFYISATAGVPVGHDIVNHTDTNGLFAVFELPVTTQAYIQVWGFVDDADLADGQMTLLAELPSPVVADTVITGSIDPLRTGN